uniref:Transmembrane protein 209 n=1 Tax=Phallusia mammillata TaxID=59560 RepID=A0A6F9DVN7_9ASCI|nr:transmembrane protein 209 [Phallusia mammillata]
MAFTTPPRKPIEAGKVSPIVKHTAQQTLNANKGKRLFTWAAVNFFAALALFYEANLQPIQRMLDIQSGPVFYGVLVLGILFTLNALVDFIQGAQSTFSVSSIVLSPEQKRLMGIRQSDPNFQNRSPQITKSASPQLPPTKTFSLSNLIKCPQTQTSTPVAGHLPFTSSPSPSPSSSFHTTIGTPIYLGNMASTSQYSPQLDHSYAQKASPVSQVFDGNSYLDSSGGSPFLRHRRSPFVNSPLSGDDYITEKKTLNNYLKSQFEKEQSKYGFDSSLGGNGSPAYWSFNSSLHDYSGELGKNLYQLSTRSPKSPTRSKHKDDPSKMATLEYWTQAGVDSSCLVEWIAKLRRWITITVLRGIVKEINKINERLKHLGCPEVQIGEASLSSLKQIQQSKASQIPGLTWIMPYLEVSQNQEYLVERLRSLASGGYMSEYRWDKGGKIKGREWSEDLVTDAAIVMHMFCTYMDSHLPPHPRYPEGKTFTSQYFVQAPRKPSTGTDTKIQILQTKFHPPHYQLVTMETTYNPPPGRHNLFVTLLLFLHWIKTKESSMLGALNLGLSGINLLCVIDPVTRAHDDVIMNPVSAKE